MIIFLGVFNEGYFAGSGMSS